eukprot:TRINITY_DN7488_c0_g3_i1.p1 TRINITY_DN7488_c0_g3~~TRINITY_DN7488_c0_g3_i1.p1  ORF type:complete len:501 (-),score=102.23 TRINITY_DN7488_c0_g3_i1:53-1555(-)
MIEGTPGVPFDNDFSKIGMIETNMRQRRLKVRAELEEGEHVLSFGGFPLLGTPKCTVPEYENGGPVTLSSYTSDKYISPHNRFSTMTQSIRERRGSKVDIRVPVYKDKNTPEQLEKDYKDEIHMDCQCFGMGMCCLQATYQGASIDEARVLYDHLGVFAPIMLALTAASPFYRGYISDVDARWDVIAASVDDRTPAERGVDKNADPSEMIPKSRYGAISLFIANDERLKDVYNDLTVKFDSEIFADLKARGFDERLSKHYAHLFIRDPLVIYEKRIDLDDAVDVDHFENIQSTNWQTVRFKPPPHGSDIGWRTEFRPMELQVTDFENAALIVFITLLTRALLAQKLNFYMPLSKVDANMKTAQKRNACLDGKFHWRKDNTGDDDSVELMTINEILNGKDGFKGIISRVEEYVASDNTFDGPARAATAKYFQLLKLRAAGKIQTTATWLRDQVIQHKAYKHDSVLTHEIVHDLIVKAENVLEGNESAPTLLADLYTLEKTS